MTAASPNVGLRPSGGQMEPWGFSTRFLTVIAIESTFGKVMTIGVVDGDLEAVSKD